MEESPVYTIHHVKSVMGTFVNTFSKVN